VDAGSAAGSSSGVSGSRRRVAEAGEPTGIRMVVDIWMMPLRLRGPDAVAFERTYSTLFPAGLEMPRQRNANDG
jgi:hypothetical protein